MLLVGVLRPRGLPGGLDAGLPLHGLAACELRGDLAGQEPVPCRP